jgi:ABC-2 type transport system permease protein
LLVLLSDFMLGVSSDLLLVHLYICVLLCLGLSGIAVGLGARFPNFRHDSPARIAAGFGGTLTLIISTSYIMAIVLLAAVPCHFYSALSDAPGGLEIWGYYGSLSFWWSACLGASLLLGGVATALPMWFGLRAFRSIEI